MYFVYVLSSQKRKYIYVGMTHNLEARVKRHNQGREKTTRPYIPFLVIHVEVFPTRIAARKREKYLKSGIGKEWIKTYCI